MKYRNILTLVLLSAILGNKGVAQELMAQDYQRVESADPQVNPYVKNLADPNIGINKQMESISPPSYVPEMLNQTELNSPSLETNDSMKPITPSPVMLQDGASLNSKILQGGEVIDLSPAPTASFPFLSGGVGADEVASIQAQKAEYNLHIMSADKLGNFTGEINLIIKDASGAEIFNGKAGPLFYAKLPNGVYHVVGKRGGETKQQKIKVGSSSAHIHFGW
jgi:hypothetical protein